jgi:hypothetical protein
MPRGKTVQEIVDVPIVDEELWRLPTRAEWQAMPLEEAHALIQTLQAKYQEGAGVYNQRTSEAAVSSGTYKWQEKADDGR